MRFGRHHRRGHASGGIFIMSNPATYAKERRIMLSVSLPESLVKAIEAERATIKPRPSRNATIGFLLEVGLEARRALSRESQISSTR